MTDQEILEAQKVIADMRNVLAVLTGTIDADKLIVLVMEKAPRLFDSYRQLHRLVISWKVISGRKVTDDMENLLVLDLMQGQLGSLLAVAELAERRPDYKEKLVAIVARQVPLIISGPDKIVQSLAAPPPK